MDLHLLSINRLEGHPQKELQFLKKTVNLKEMYITVSKVWRLIKTAYLKAVLHVHPDLKNELTVCISP